MASDGYVNLLPARHSSDKIRGDSRAMLRARRRFLERGHYVPLSDALNEVLHRHLAGAMGEGDGSTGRTDSSIGSAAACVVDLGCGEGYYLGRLERYLDERLAGERVWYVGFDIAKDAVRLAARRYPDAQFAVADVRARVPCRDASVAAALSLFAPRRAEEMARIVTPGGLLLVAIPAPAHLQQLRTMLPLLGMEPEKEHRLIERLGHEFALETASEIAYDLDLGGGDTVDLVQMTPSARHLPPTTIAAVGTLEGVRTTVAFRVLTFRRAAAPRQDAAAFWS
ncbi:MAG: methyltransferase domain-containing protein [Chloroflexi bacterium]|nr:methyltransferase domain-containing protein [Chloroflexota bacterium]